MLRSKARNRVRAKGQMSSGKTIASIGLAICRVSYGGWGQVRTRVVTKIAIVTDSARSRLNQSAPSV